MRKRMNFEGLELRKLMTADMGLEVDVPQDGEQIESAFVSTYNEAVASAADHGVDKISVEMEESVATLPEERAKAVDSAFAQDDGGGERSPCPAINLLANHAPAKFAK